jgi:hypothetical protein
MMREMIGWLVLGLLGAVAPAGAAVATYGNANLFGFGYPGGADPTAGATLQGLAPGVTTSATNGYSHPYPFSPAAGDLGGTHQIYVGQVQTATRDGYANEPSRAHAPDVININYSALIPAGQTVQTFTLGIGIDDFQYPVFGDPIHVAVNGIPITALDNAFMSDDMEIPSVNAGYEHFWSVGLSTAPLPGAMTLSINEGGDGGDGWAVDFVTVGVTVPEPTGALLATAGTLLLCARRSRARLAGRASGVTRKPKR